MYKLDFKTFSTGTIMGHPSALPLTYDDYYLLGGKALEMDELELAIDWLNLAETARKPLLSGFTREQVKLKLVQAYTEVRKIKFWWWTYTVEEVSLYAITLILK